MVRCNINTTAVDCFFVILLYQMRICLMNTVAKTQPNKDLSVIWECIAFNAGSIIESGITVLKAKIETI